MPPQSPGGRLCPGHQPVACEDTSLPWTLLRLESGVHPGPAFSRLACLPFPRVLTASGSLLLQEEADLMTGKFPPAKKASFPQVISKQTRGATMSPGAAAGLCLCGRRLLAPAFRPRGHSGAASAPSLCPEARVTGSTVCEGLPAATHKNNCAQ